MKTSQSYQIPQEDCDGTFLLGPRPNARGQSVRKLKLWPVNCDVRPEEAKTLPGAISVLASLALKPP